MESPEKSLTVALPPKLVEDEWAGPSTPCLQEDNPYFQAYSSTTVSSNSADKQPDNPSSPTGLSEKEIPTAQPSASCLTGDTDREGLSNNASEKTESNPAPCDEEDGEIFECGICTDDLVVPKSLPCLHNFCLECLKKYLKVNSLQEGQSFSCPTCRASVKVPRGGAFNFPTNFHIVNLRRKSRELDLGLTIKGAVRYLECRAEEIVDDLTESKRQVLINIGKRREFLIGQIEDTVETLQEAAEEQYTLDSTKAVDNINSIKTKLSDLQAQLGSTQNLSCSSTSSAEIPETIHLNALTKLRRQAEIITNVNNELEELKREADRDLSNLLEYQLVFCPGPSSKEPLRKHFGRLLMLQEGQTLVDADTEPDEGFSPLHVRSWSQSWWVLLFAVLPAIICALLVKVLMTLFEKLLD